MKVFEVIILFLTIFHQSLPKGFDLRLPIKSTDPKVRNYTAESPHDKLFGISGPYISKSEHDKWSKNETQQRKKKNRTSFFVADYMRRGSSGRTPSKTIKSKRTTTKPLYRTRTDNRNYAIPRSKHRGRCGIDNSENDNDTTHIGSASVETYPWLGILFYPIVEDYVTTAVVLVTRDLVLASATDIDQMPKYEFRKLARVILGSNCTGPPSRGIGILSIAYHSDFNAQTQSALVLIQLDLNDFEMGTVLRPICGPPDQLFESDFYAMVLPDDCEKPTLKVYKMEYVSPSNCTTFYRRTELDIERFWPKHTACARATSGGDCVWKNGAVLSVKQDGQWHLLGIGVYGPGCQAISRFQDYGKYHGWVVTSTRRMGQPAVTRIDDAAHLQRFGRCDEDELKQEIYSDTELIRWDSDLEYGNGHAFYNLTLFSNVDYSCVLLKAYYPILARVDEKPHMNIRFYCTTPKPICFQTGMERIDFYVKIYFVKELVFKIMVYGQERKVVDHKSLTKYANLKRDRAYIPWHPLYYPGDLMEGKWIERWWWSSWYPMED